MCIAILKTKEGKLTDEMLTESFNSNGDGAGIAYSQNGILYIVKGIFSAKELIEQVHKAEQICDGNMLIHCRIGTSGTKDANNTHPFLVVNKPGEAVALIHNGILDVTVPKNSEINDTQIFIRDYLSEMDRDTLMNNKGVHKLIGEVIGYNNKFVLMDNHNNYTIINENQGHWKDGVWFSNHSYMPTSYGLFGNRDYWGGYETSTSYYEDENDYDENYRLKGYGASGLKITEEEYDDILNAINKLTDEEIVNMGYYPSYSFITGEITGEADDNGYHAIPLEDLSCELYDYFLDKCDWVETIGNQDNEDDEENVIEVART